MLFTLILCAACPVDSVREGGHGSAGGIAADGRSAVVKVQMREDDVGHILRRYAVLPQRFADVRHVVEAIVDGRRIA